MSMLATGQLGLFSDLKSSYKNASDNGEAGFDPVPDLAAEQATAIYEYMITAKVQTGGVVTPGQMTAFIPNTPSVVVAPGNFTGTGTIDFEDGAVDGLRSALEKAYYDAADTGAAGGDVAEQLSIDVSTAIYEFAIQAKVETDVEVKPGASLAPPYMS
ncbi:MAG TPA: hypothetical protein DCQ49_00600, partial [Methylophaga sp.]|nr:hypothetical protein [Methylophaga sp.]